MTISVLLPSRGRPGSLRRSVESLYNSASNPDSIRVLVGYDSDDPETRVVVDDMNLFACEFRQRNGYHQLHLYVNRLAEVANGDWLFLWNDDALMDLQGWDDVFHSFDHNSPLVLSPSSTGVEHTMCCFPAISRTLYNILGHMSLSNHIDSWLQDLANSLSILRKLDVHVFHDRFDLTGGHNDQTFAESSSGYRTEEFYSARMQSLLRTDIEKVSKWLILAGSDWGS